MRVTSWLFAALATACLVPNHDFEDSYASDSGAASLTGGVTTDLEESDATSAASGSDSASGSGAASTGVSTDTSDTTDTTDTEAATAADHPCDSLECGPNAACVLLDGGAACVCDPGFVQEGAACADLDECADAPCDPGFCKNFPGSYACAYPQTCAELKALAPATPDGAHHLYVDGQAAQPWLAWCHDMANDPREYLTLPKQGVLENIANYNGGTVRTTQYQRLRLDPTTWRVDTADATFTTDLGLALYDGKSVKKVAYGAAVGCAGVAAATINLKGTPFIVTSNWCLGGMTTGHGKSGSGQEFDISVVAACGWHAPALSGCPVPSIPINGVGPPLQLAYSPP